jgi:hypothetical protein
VNQVMADTYTIKINRRDGSIEASGDKDWVEEKLAQFAEIYSGPLAEASGGDREPQRQTPRTRRKASRKPPDDGAQKTPRRRATAPTRVKGLDLSPAGKQSFEEFVAEKQPVNQHDRNLSSVYYLAEVAEVSPVTIDHVYTCYRDRGWAIPSNLRNSLQLTASRKTYLDTADMDDIKLEPRGVNHIERALPAREADS